MNICTDQQMMVHSSDVLEVRRVFQGQKLFFPVKVDPVVSINTSTHTDVMVTWSSRNILIPVRWGWKTSRRSGKEWGRQEKASNTTFTIILSQPPTAQNLVQPAALWGLLSRNWMRNDYSDKFNTTSLQNHYVPTPPPPHNHNSHFSKHPKRVCSESKESNAILDDGSGTAEQLEATDCIWLQHTNWMCQNDSYWITVTRMSNLMADLCHLIIPQMIFWTNRIWNIFCCFYLWKRFVWSVNVT